MADNKQPEREYCGEYLDLVDKPIQFGIDIGAYVLAERERCAKIAEKWLDSHPWANNGQIELAQCIAAAIRSGR